MFVDYACQSRVNFACQSRVSFMVIVTADTANIETNQTGKISYYKLTLNPKNTCISLYILRKTVTKVANFYTSESLTPVRQTVS